MNEQSAGYDYYAAPEEATVEPVQGALLPQREWLRGPLKEWATDCVREAYGGTWLDAAGVASGWEDYYRAGSNSSFAQSQSIDLGLMAQVSRGVAPQGARQFV